jgi:hypothetical protein
LVEAELITKDIALSYYIEGLLYNVPNDKFSGNYENIVFTVLQWLQQTTDRTRFKEYYLLQNNSHVYWPCANDDQFIDAAISLWNDW